MDSNTGTGEKLYDKSYDCLKCPGMCCSVYQNVQATERDVRRMAEVLRIKVGRFVKQYLKPGGLNILKQKDDPVFGRTCIMFDTEERRCSVYASRPQVCRDWPHTEHQVPGKEGHCCYYDVYQFTNMEASVGLPAHQPRPHVVPLIKLTRLVVSK